MADRLREMNRRTKPAQRKFDDDIDEIFSPVGFPQEEIPLNSLRIHSKC